MEIKEKFIGIVVILTVAYFIASCLNYNVTSYEIQKLAEIHNEKIDTIDALRIEMEEKVARFNDSIQSNFISVLEHQQDSINVLMRKTKNNLDFLRHYNAFLQYENLILSQVILKRRHQLDEMNLFTVKSDPIRKEVEELSSRIQGLEDSRPKWNILTYL